ncbi:stress response protein NST1-like [Cannabis sativa]|uniref:stress response protein NST1-like n=1 Tax=Cannabis sativa TaxID=3483 RepID=UPI0029CA670C|nr:stress response protein NST1-like [Cannabis sativa]
MSMAQCLKLSELLKEDQEPFVLKNYISDRLSQLKTADHPRNHLQLKKRKPISENRSFPGKFCKTACFLSLNESPDPRKSPLFEFQSPAKSPCKNSNAIFLHIPARTAALLLDAALRIQKQSSSSSSKTKTQKLKNGFGLFGSFLKRLKNRNRSNRTREIEGGNGVKVKPSVKDILRKVNTMEEKVVRGDDQVMTGCEISGSCPCTGRPSSATIWSETNEEKSLDLETSSSTSSHYEHSDEIDFLTKLVRESNNNNNGDIDFSFCDHENENDFSQSPFRFVLTRSPSSAGHRTPEFSSPAPSPSRHKQEEKIKKCVSENQEFQRVKNEEEEEEEEKEQFSPVSVLDPPFEDDYDGHEDEDEDEDNGFDMESSFASVQRTKQQLLQKLRRFEKLAELDPIELEKRMLDEEEDDDEEEEECEDDESDVGDFVREVLGNSRLHQVQRIPRHMKRLVSDVMLEERREENTSDYSEEVAKRVCKRFESWKEVQCNTIDMMVEQDYSKDLQGWTTKNNKEQMGETAIEIEYAIFGLLVEELAAELVCLDGK